MVQESFLQMLNKFQANLEELYKNANTKNNLSVQQSNQLLSNAYKELGIASEELQIAIEELMIKSEELAATQIHLEAERQHYKNLFEFLPDAYLVTDCRGNIIQANEATATLFKVESRFLINKPIDLFFSTAERQQFPNKLSQLYRCNQQQRWTLELQLRNGELIKVVAKVAPSYNSQSKLTALHWSLRNLDKDNQIQSLGENGNGNSKSENLTYTYQQGDIIALNPNSLWIIDQGWVKLTTITESGQEVLIGLVGDSMAFGSSLTSLPTYQASVLSQKAHLSCVPLTQLFNYPNIQDKILPQIIDRLQQTESLLAITGVRQINERVRLLLEWLRNNYSEKLTGGDRLRVRLTHQELANACGTTRVTITRVLGQLKKQGIINYDAKHHLIFLE